MAKKALLLFLVLFISTNCFPQHARLEDMRKELDKALLPEERILALNNLVKALATNDPHAAIDFGLQAVELAICHDNEMLMANSYHNLGTVYQLLGVYKTAAEYNFKALEIREAIGDSLGTCTSYNNIGNINNYLEDYKTAHSYYTKSYEIALKLKNKVAISRALNNLGYTSEVQNDNKKALYYYGLALPIKEEIGDTTGISVSLLNLGEIHVKDGKTAEGIVYLKRGLDLAQKTDNQLNVGYGYRGLAKAYLQEGNITKATEYALLGLNVAQQYSSYFEIMTSAEVLNTIYLQAGDFKKAHQYLALSAAYKDTLHSENNKRQFEELQVKYQSDKKDKENTKLLAEGEIQQKMLNSQKRVIYLIGALLITFATLAFEFFRGKRQFSRLNKRLARKNDKISRSRKKMRDQQRALVKQAVQLQEQKELLEKSNHIKDKLFSIVAHDLRSPLASLSGMTRLLRKGSIPENKKNAFLKMVEVEQQNSLWLIDNLFIWAKTQMSGANVNPVCVNLQQLAQENIRLLLPQATKKEISLVSTVSPEHQAFADNEMIKLVLRNLISNAIKFCREGDSIRVSTNKLDDYIFVSVTDTGVGISEANLRKLFDGNFTNRGTANEKGSGLGLQLCKDFIELNNGTIWAESEAGKGSTFTFTLPVAPASSPTPKPLDSFKLVYK